MLRIQDRINSTVNPNWVKTNQNYLRAAMVEFDNNIEKASKEIYFNSLMDSPDEVAEQFTISDGDISIMVDLHSQGYHSGEQEFIDENDNSYRMIWAVEDF